MRGWKETERHTQGVTGTSSSRGRAGQVWNCAEPSSDGEPATQPRRPTGCHPKPGSLQKWPRRERDRERQATETERHRQAGRKSDRDSDGPGGRGTQTLCTREGVSPATRPAPPQPPASRVTPAVCRCGSGSDGVTGVYVAVPDGRCVGGSRRAAVSQLSRGDCRRF